MDATPAINRRLTLEVVKEQIINAGSSSPCLVQISLKTVQLDSMGNLPVTSTAPAGATIHVTLEDDVPLEVTVPEEPTYPLARLIGANTSRPPGDTLRDIRVTSGGQYQLTASHVGKLLTLTTGTVHGFTLNRDANANSHKIVNLSPAVSPGDLMSFGTPAGGDLMGTYPNPTVKFFIAGVPIASFPILAMDPGDCLTRDTMVDGAMPGDPVAISPRTPTAHLSWLAWVPLANTVRLRLCALAPIMPAPSIYDPRVIQ